MSDKKKQPRISFDDIFETIQAAGFQKTWTHVLHIPKHLEEETIEMANNAGTYSLRWNSRLYGYRVYFRGDSIDVVRYNPDIHPIW